MKRMAISLATGITAALLLGGCIDTSSYQYYATDKGIAEFKAGDYATAAGSFEDAVRIEPRDYVAEYYLAASHDALKMHQQAVGEYKAALAVMSTTSEGRRDTKFRYQILDALAQSIARGEDVDAQIAELKHGPDTAENFYLLAKVYQYAQDADSALVNYDKATLMDPHNTRYAEEYGLYLDRIGQTGKAEQQLQKARSMGDKDPRLLSALQRLQTPNAPAPAATPEPEARMPGGMATTQPAARE